MERYEWVAQRIWKEEEVTVNIFTPKKFQAVKLKPPPIFLT